MLTGVMKETANIQGIGRSGDCSQWKHSSFASCTILSLCLPPSQQLLRLFSDPSQTWEKSSDFQGCCAPALQELQKSQPCMLKSQPHTQKSQPRIQQPGRKLKGQRGGKIIICEISQFKNSKYFVAYPSLPGLDDNNSSSHRLDP